MKIRVKIILPIVLAATLGGAAATTFAGKDRPPTPEEREKIMKALEELGYSSPGEIEIEGKTIEVEDVLHTDGKRYELKLDAKTLKVLKRKVDDD